MTTQEFALIEKLFDLYRYFVDRDEHAQALIISKFNLRFIKRRMSIVTRSLT